MTFVRIAHKVEQLRLLCKHDTLVTALSAKHDSRDSKPWGRGGRTVSVLEKPAQGSRNKIRLHKRTSNFIKENVEFFGLNLTVVI